MDTIFMNSKTNKVSDAVILSFRQNEIKGKC